MTAPAIPSLSVIVPVYNEPEAIRDCIAHADAAIEASPFAGVTEILVVDDGSAEPTKRALGALSPRTNMRVISQENRGRFAARETGVRSAEGDLVLLLDSRVRLARDSLRFIASQLNGAALPAWNGHVDIDVSGNPFARFWRTITYFAWRDYFANPRTTSFGLAEYDRYPKGTGCFIAPRERLLDAIGEFRSIYRDMRYSSDDTVLIRSIAANQPINISPGFLCSYTPRDSLPGFLRHTFHRGTTFVDSFGRRGTRFFPAVLAFFPTSIAFAILAARRPRLVVAAGSCTIGGAAMATVAAGRTPADGLAFALVGGPFALAYAAGIWRGGLMAVYGRMKR